MATKKAPTIESAPATSGELMSPIDDIMHTHVAAPAQDTMSEFVPVMAMGKITMPKANPSQGDVDFVYYLHQLKEKGTQFKLHDEVVLEALKYIKDALGVYKYI
ncbi:hypothetical protein H0H87_005924 [Tephrocybe sp. NHM501043]|nr:hypothetical protein H0H87_005924 [Tephrocybe sp. NHM501043]